MGWEMALTAAGYAFDFMSSMSAAKAESRAAAIEAQQMEINAKAAELRGRQEAFDIQKEAQAIDAANLAGAAGYDPYSSMSFLALDDENKDQTRSAAGTAVDNAQLNSLGYLSNAALIRSSAKANRTSSYLSGIGNLLSGGMKLIELAPGSTASAATKRTRTVPFHQR